MGDLRLLLEDGAHQARQLRIDLRDLLKLVENEHDVPFALSGELTRKLEQPLELRQDVLC